MPILKKLRSKLKQRLTGGKKKSTSKNNKKKVTLKNSKKPTTPKRKKVTYSSTPRQRAGETWSAYQIRIGNKKVVKKANKAKKKMNKTIAKNTKKRGRPARWGVDAKTGKVIDLKTGKVRKRGDYKIHVVKGKK
tara:strand:+ start:505 stop:906 length:402 start_codon:yes stop_codon:yes gene_type:complete